MPCLQISSSVTFFPPAMNFCIFASKSATCCTRPASRCTIFAFSSFREYEVRLNYCTPWVEGGDLIAAQLLTQPFCLAGQISTVAPASFTYMTRFISIAPIVVNHTCIAKPVASFLLKLPFFRITVSPLQMDHLYCSANWSLSLTTCSRAATASAKLLRACAKRFEANKATLSHKRPADELTFQAQVIWYESYRIPIP